MSVIRRAGKSIEKLFATVAAGIGVDYKPEQSLLNFQESDQAANDQSGKSMLISHGDVSLGLIERARQRLGHQEIKRQENLDSIIEKSSSMIADDVSDVSVDEDWRAKYFNKAQDVSSVSLQFIWAKILAEEVARPGRTSIRTLDILSNLTKHEADLFEKAASLSFFQEYIFKIDSENAFENFGVSYENILDLRAAGLIHQSNTMNVTFVGQNHQAFEGVMLIFGNKLLSVYKSGTDKYVFNQVCFTPAGKELCSVLDMPKNFEYLNYFIENKLKAEGYEVKILN